MKFDNILAGFGGFLLYTATQREDRVSVSVSNLAVVV